jgi:hypothetical protein
MVLTQLNETSARNGNKDPSQAIIVPNPGEDATVPRMQHLARTTRGYVKSEQLEALLAEAKKSIEKKKRS